MIQILQNKNAPDLILIAQENVGLFWNIWKDDSICIALRSGKGT